MLFGVGSTPGLGLSAALTVGFEVSSVVVASSSSPRLRVGVVARLVLPTFDGRPANVAPFAVSRLSSWRYLNYLATALTRKRSRSRSALTSSPPLTLLRIDSQFPAGFAAFAPSIPRDD